MSHEDEYLSVAELIEFQKGKRLAFIIEALIEDGSDPEALYDIEHHLFAEDFEVLEKAVGEAFKMGLKYLKLKKRQKTKMATSYFVCDATMQSALDAEAIDAQVEKLVNLAEEIRHNLRRLGHLLRR
ncbi:ribonuclease E inhibitor RraB [Vibrio chagasii]|nr:ribonuclease E inhibitor RraB [Vibrio chagasii]